MGRQCIMNQRINSLENELEADSLRLVNKYISAYTNINLWASFNNISRLNSRFKNLLHPTKNELLLFELEFGANITGQYLRIINESEK